MSDIGRLVLTRKVGEGVIIRTPEAEMLFTVARIGNNSVSLQFAPLGELALTPGSYPQPMLGGLTLQLDRIIKGCQVKMLFVGPKSVTVLRRELDPQVCEYECPGCGYRISAARRNRGGFDFDCSSCQNFTISQYRGV